MQPERGEAVGGAGSLGGEGADAAGSVIAAESAPCEVLVGKTECWATAIAAAGAFSEPVPSLESTAKTDAKAVLAAGKNLRGRDGDRRW